MISIKRAERNGDRDQPLVERRLGVHGRRDARAASRCLVTVSTVSSTLMPGRSAMLVGRLET